MKTRASDKKTNDQPQEPSRRGRRENKTDTKSSKKKYKNKKNYFQVMLQNETPEQRARRLQRHKDDKLKRRAAETEEEKLERKRIEAEYMKNRRHNETPEQRKARLAQRSKHYREKRDKMGKLSKEKAILNKLKIQHEKNIESMKIQKRTEVPTSLPSNITPPKESVQGCTITYGTQNKKVTTYDAVSNLLHAICKKQHPKCNYLQHNQPQYFLDRCSPNSNEVLVAVFWRKYSSQFNKMMKSSLHSKS